ncbi:MAG: 3-deoxy-D-manno-octulosonic acid transferase [Terriglobales bacterium]
MLLSSWTPQGVAALVAGRAARSFYNDQSMYFLYSLSLAVLLALGAPWWTLQMLRSGKYRAGLAERFGRVPARLRSNAAAACIWVHAVSVGEVLAIAGFVRELRAKFPACRVLVSTTTATGQKLARERFGAENVFYFPLDFAFAIRPYLRALHPELVIIAETEFWPNFLRLSKRSGARIAVVNARLSDRSFPRYRPFQGIMRAVLEHVDLFCTQTEEDARRLRAVGAPAQRIQVSGNMKFDLKLPSPPLIASLRAALKDAGPVIVCGSTVEGEEPVTVHAFRQVQAKYPDAVMILAPRHPERFAPVAELLVSSQVRFWRRTQWNPAEKLSGGIFLLDSIGELGAVYSLASIAFVGGSLAPRGGHNILEPAYFSVPILVGPHTENFRDIVTQFARAGAVRVVQDGQQLTAAFLALLSDSSEREALGRRAAEVVRQGAGATGRTLASLERLHTQPAHKTANVEVSS